MKVKFSCGIYWCHHELTLFIKMIEENSYIEFSSVYKWIDLVEIPQNFTARSNLNSISFGKCKLYQWFENQMLNTIIWRKKSTSPFVDENINHHTLQVSISLYCFLVFFLPESEELFVIHDPHCNARFLFLFYVVFVCVCVCFFAKVIYVYSLYYELMHDKIQIRDIFLRIWHSLMVLDIFSLKATDLKCCFEITYEFCTT